MVERSKQRSALFMKVFNYQMYSFFFCQSGHKQEDRV